MSDNSTSTPNFSLGDIYRKYKGPLIIIGVLVVIALIALLVHFVVTQYTYSVKNEGERKEQNLVALYGDSQSSLSQCLDSGRVAAQVTQKEYDSVKDILVSTAGARYADGSTATSVLGGGKYISALQENYPQIDQRSWQNLQTVVVGCREEFQGKQDKIQAFASDYNQWRVSDNVFNAGIKAKFPSDELTVNTTTEGTLRGQAAYDRITHVVTVAAATEAFESGELDEQDLFNNDK